MKNKIYLDIESPVNNEEFSMLVYNIIANAPDFGINLNDIPKPKEARFKTYILDLFFQHYTLVTYLDFVNNHSMDNVVVEEKAPESIKNKNVEYKTGLLTKKEYEEKQQFYDSILKTIGRTAVKVRVFVDGNSRNVSRSFIMTNHDDEYYKDLLDKDGLWDKKIMPKVEEAIRACKEKECNNAKEKFRKECIPDKKKFADALIVYCEIFRDIADVHKYIEHCLAINKWIKGEETPSHLLCMYNTDSRFGRNGKTWRIEAERIYMEHNGFTTSAGSLSKDGCSSINDFSYHLYYKDEYDFSDSTSDFLKSINKNIRPRISARVMYLGNQIIENEAIIYLSCYNGKPSEKIISSERIASTIRCTDAMYSKHKEEMVDICLKRPEKGDCKNKIYYEDLFDGLIKSAVDYNHDKIKTGEEEFKITPSLLEVISSEGNDLLNINRLVRILGARKYYNPEKARREFKDLYGFLYKKYPNFIANQAKKNWNERSLDNTDGKLLELLETVAGLQTVDVSDELLDKQILRNYIYSLFDLDPNAPVENTTIVDRASNTNKTKQWLEECIDSAKQSSTGI